MRTAALGFPHSPSSSTSPPLPSIATKKPFNHFQTPSDPLHRVNSLQRLFRGVSPPQFFDSGITSRVGVCLAGQTIDLFPPICPEFVVRDARVEDCWEVADTHCSSFFPNYSFPIDLLLRIDRFIGLLHGFSVPTDCMRTCLIAVAGSSGNDNLYVGNTNFKIRRFERRFNLSRGSVAGILTVDTLADYLPRKGPLRQKRTGIAYISNLAVRKADRRKGIAKLLLAKAEARAFSWGCRSIALHCDANNTAATRLYKGQGFKLISVPENGRWPQPKTFPHLQFYFMMKLLTFKGTT